MADQINRRGPWRRRPTSYADPNPPYGIPGSRGIASPDLVFFNGWVDSHLMARVCHYDRARASDAGAVGECLANPHFGTVISESGSAYTWSENATNSA